MIENPKIYLRDILDNTVSIIQSMTLMDYLEILILAWFMYVLIRFVRETRAEQLLKGIFFIFIITMALRSFDFKVLGALSSTILNMGVIAVIVMFQPELRRVLEKMGRIKVSKTIETIAQNFETTPYKLSAAIEQISRACEKLSRTATGALIVMERETRLGEQVGTGTVINAIPSIELFGNIFFPNAPLHDGAVIIRDGLALSAGCFLPKPQKEEDISKDLGSRHRAAIGMSEVSDAIVIVVSEETGTISIAENGVLNRGFNYEKLRDYLMNAFLPDSANKSKKSHKKNNSKNNPRNKQNQNKQGQNKASEVKTAEKVAEKNQDTETGQG